MTNPTAPSTPVEEIERAIYFAWQADERWLQMDLAVLAKGTPLAYFWCQIAARAAMSAITSRPAPSVEPTHGEIEAMALAVLERDAKWAPSGDPNDCNCINLNREAEQEYETGNCPHQRLRAALTSRPAPSDKHPSPKDDFSERNDPFGLDPTTVEACAKAAESDAWCKHARVLPISKAIAAAIRALIPDGTK